VIFLVEFPAAEVAEMLIVFFSVRNFPGTIFAKVHVAGFERGSCIFALVTLGAIGTFDTEVFLADETV